MAYSKAGRHPEALADAEGAASLAPTWDKPHMRQGIALLGLLRLPEAIAAFVQGWKVSSGGAPHLKFILFHECQPVKVPLSS